METRPDIGLAGTSETQELQHDIACLDQIQTSNAQQLPHKQSSSLTAESPPVDAQLAAAWGTRTPEQIRAWFNPAQGLSMWQSSRYKAQVEMMLGTWLTASKEPANPFEKLAISSACDGLWKSPVAVYIRRTVADVEKHQTVKTQKWDEAVKVNVTTWATRYRFGNRRHESPQDDFGHLDQIHENGTLNIRVNMVHCFYNIQLEKVSCAELIEKQDLKAYQHMWAMLRPANFPEIPNDDERLSPRQLDWLITRCGSGTTTEDAHPSGIVEGLYSSTSAIDLVQIPDGKPPENIPPVRRVYTIVNNRSSDNDNEEYDNDGLVNGGKDSDDYGGDDNDSFTDTSEICVHSSCELQRADTTHDPRQQSSNILNGQRTQPGVDSSQLPESVKRHGFWNDNHATGNGEPGSSGSQRGGAARDTQQQKSSEQHDKDGRPVSNSSQRSGGVALDRPVDNTSLPTGLSLDFDDPHRGETIHDTHQPWSSGQLGREERRILRSSERRRGEITDPSVRMSLVGCVEGVTMSSQSPVRLSTQRGGQDQSRNLKSYRSASEHDKKGGILKRALQRLERFSCFGGSAGSSRVRRRALMMEESFGSMDTHGRDQG